MKENPLITIGRGILFLIIIIGCFAIIFFLGEKFCYLIGKTTSKFLDLNCKPISTGQYITLDRRLDEKNCYSLVGFLITLFLLAILYTSYMLGNTLKVKAK